MATAKQLRLLSKTSESQVSFLSGLCPAQFNRRDFTKGLSSMGQRMEITLYQVLYYKKKLLPLVLVARKS